MPNDKKINKMKDKTLKLNFFFPRGVSFVMLPEIRYNTLVIEFESLIPRGLN